jgi:hopene-associated glycosyltransferase HpnB
VAAIAAAVLSALAAAGWALCALDPYRGGRRIPLLAPQPTSAAAGPAPEASVLCVVPARNEATVLAATLPSLLDQRSPALRIVLVDDGSSDGTAAIARRIGAASDASDRLRIVRPPATPAGWAGKVWALDRGLAAAEAWVREAETTELESSQERPANPDWVLFTDADIRHRPGTVADLLRKAETGTDGGPYDLVSVMARLHAESFWERLLLPAFLFFFHGLYPFGRISQPNARISAAAGGCVLLRRSALDRAGGPDAIRNATIDDVALARAIRAAGGSLWLGLDAGIESVRPYEGLAPIWRMVARSAFVQIRRRWDLLLLTVAALGALVVAPPVLALLGAFELLLGDAASLPAAAVTLAAGLLAWTCQARVLQPWLAYLLVPRVYAWSLPAAGALYALMTISSAWDHVRGRGARWKGRSYSDGSDPGPDAGSDSESDSGSSAERAAVGPRPPEAS